MKTRIQSLSFLATLAIALGMIAMGGTLHAQNSPSSSPDSQAQQPSQSPDTTQTPPPQSQEPPSTQSPSSQPSQTPDTNRTPDTTPQSTPPSGSASGAAGAGTDSQVFSGTVVKSGDKYVLKDDTGHTYDIDHQDEVKKFEGKRVRVQGTLDPSGNKIMVK